MSELDHIRGLIQNETELAAFLKKFQDEQKSLVDNQKSLEVNTDNLFILVNAIIVYCKYRDNFFHI